MGQFLNFNGEYSGLSADEAEANLDLYGLNYESKKDGNDVRMSIGLVFIKPPFIALIVSAVLYVAAGQVVMGLASFVLSAILVISELFKITTSQESLDEIAAATSMKFRVIRDGEIELVSKEYLVPDDIMLIQGGENVPADAHLLEINGFSVDEYIFTSDPTPVTKVVGTDSKNNIKTSCIYSGTKIVSGSAVARIIATGVDTKRYKTFGEEIHNKKKLTVFEEIVNKSVPVFCLAGVIMAVVYFLVSLVFIDTLVDSGEFHLFSAINAVGLIMCFLPTQLCSTIRLYYVHSANKLAKSHAVVKNLGVLETMNSLTSIIIEKAGNITKADLEVAEIYSKDSELMYNISVLSCDTFPNLPQDKAFILHATFNGVDVKSLQQNDLLKSYLYSATEKMGGNLWSLNGQRLLCIKGSAEAILPMCDLNGEQLFNIQKKHAAFGNSGLEVAVIAYSILKNDDEIPDIIFGRHYNYMGMIAFTNPTRDTIPFAIRTCYKAGVKVIMTTIDSEETAVAIAKKIGMKNGRVITGEQIKQAERDGEKLDYGSVNIFAAITADQKLEILKHLQANGEIVAIAGETIDEDVLLQQANIGIATVQNATGVAYEASDVLMNDDNFANIVDSIKESRQSHQNIKRYISTVLSSVIGTIILSIISLAFGYGHICSPVLIGIFSTVIVPVCSMCYLRNNTDMKNELYSSGFIGRGVINRKFFMKSVVQGIAAGLALVLMFVVAASTLNVASLRSLCLITYTSSMAAMVWVNSNGNYLFIKDLSDKKSSVSITLITTLILIVFSVILVYTPVLNSSLGLEAINPFFLIIGLVCGFISQMWYEVVKYVNQKARQEDSI